MATKDKELPSYMRRAEKKAAKRAVRHARRAAHAVRNAGKSPKKSLGEKWDDLTEGPLGTLIYIVLGILIALAVNEGLKPVLQTDTPVVAVFSESMVPTFEKGDMVVVQGGTTVVAGDVVVYDSPIYKYPIIHRVINITDAGVTTKGDNNASPDPWVTPKEKIHGKAILRVPYLGWVKVGAYELLKLI
jgi:signal peptidase